MVGASLDLMHLSVQRRTYVPTFYTYNLYIYILEEGRTEGDHKNIDRSTFICLVNEKLGAVWFGLYVRTYVPS